MGDYSRLVGGTTERAIYKALLSELHDAWAAVSGAVRRGEHIVGLEARNPTSSTSLGGALRAMGPVSTTTATAHRRRPRGHGLMKLSQLTLCMWPQERDTDSSLFFLLLKIFLHIVFNFQVSIVHNTFYASPHPPATRSPNAPTNMTPCGQSAPLHASRPTRPQAAQSLRDMSPVRWPPRSPRTDRSAHPALAKAAVADPPQARLLIHSPAQLGNGHIIVYE